MPYMAVGHTVYKKNEDGSRGSKVGTTKGDVRKYLSALHANENKNKKGKSPVATYIEKKGV